MSLGHTAFYGFVPLPDPDRVAVRLRELTRELLGSILVAPEGLNGMLAGRREALDAFEAALQDDPAFEGRFAGIDFKRSACKTAPFARMRVRRKARIVPFGVSGVPQRRGHVVSPEAWRALIAEPDVVLLDNRNSFEHRLGRFAGAIDPQVAHFREFAAWVESHAPEWKAAGRRVAMYCTGGIRCEKTSGWMADLGLDVYELEGGILNYFRALPQAGAEWQGECFVFDNRVAVDRNLEETATTLAEVHAGHPEEAWRLQRGTRLAEEG
jgi:UPF0176 protein